MNLEIGDEIQWIKGDNFGKTETIKDLKDGFVVFESGGQIYTNVFKEFMQKIDENSDIIIDPNDTLNTRKVGLNENVKPTNPPEQKIVETSSISDNVKSILNTFKKSSEKINEDNKIDVILKLEGLPALNVIKMMYNVFEEDDVDKALIVFLENKIQSIIAQIGRTIKDSSDV